MLRGLEDRVKKFELLEIMNHGRPSAAEGIGKGSPSAIEREGRKRVQFFRFSGSKKQYTEKKHQPRPPLWGSKK